MRERTISRWIPAVIAVMSIIAAAGAAQAGEFTADVIITTGVKVDTLNISVKDNLYRLTSVESDVEEVIIGIGGGSYVINHGKKHYRACTGEAQVDPLKAWGSFAYDLQGTYDGVDTVRSNPCQRYSYRREGTDKTVLVRWYSRALNFVIKQARFEDDGEMTMELVNIKQAELNDALFEIPEDYELISPVTDSRDPVLHRDVGPPIPPELVFRQEPEYPRITDSANVSCAVWVRALVDLQGNVRKVIVHKSSGSEAFDEAAIAAAYKYEFKPGMQEGRPIECWVSFKVVFEL